MALDSRGVGAGAIKKEAVDFCCISEIRLLSLFSSEAMKTMSMTISLRASDNEAEELNVSNVNFWSICELIGEPIVYSDYVSESDGKTYSYPETPCWNTTDALLDLQFRLTQAIESLSAMPALDGGVEGSEEIGEFGCRVINCGRREGYYADRLTQLSKLVTLALDRGDTLLVG